MMVGYCYSSVSIPFAFFLVDYVLYFIEGVSIVPRHIAYMPSTPVLIVSKDLSAHSFTCTALRCVISTISSKQSSLPIPDCLYPPKGMNR